MLKKIIGNLAKGIAAGIVIAIGCAVYLACANKVVGAVFFSVALVTICYLEYSLFTGKIGFIVEVHDKDAFSVLLLGLLGNLIGTWLCGLLLKVAIPSLGETAAIMCEAKLTQKWYQTVIRGIFCGLLMYIAVAIFKNNKTPLGILLAIPVFILSGFEHSIADMGYFATSGIVSFKAMGFIWLVIIGNSIGAMILPLLKKLWTEKKHEEN